jgi:hypothetical protein
MKLIESRILKLGDKELPVRITNRAQIEYKSLSGVTTVNFQDTEQLVQFLYCTAKAGAKHNGVVLSYSYDQFLDLVDEYYTELIICYTELITDLTESFSEGSDEIKKKTTKR